MAIGAQSLRGTVRVSPREAGRGKGEVGSGKGKREEGAKMDTNWKHQKNAITTDQKSVYFTMTENNASSDLHGIVQRFSVRSTKGK